MTELPRSVVTKVCSLADAQDPLVGDEYALLVGANSSRRREIIGGRTLARRAMGELGYPRAQVKQGSSGAPIWPFGICGSISHSAFDVAVAIARTSHIRSIGIDIEDGRDLGLAESSIAKPHEIQSVMKHPLADGHESAVRMIFSAKEAVYKCLAPLSDEYGLDFLDIWIERTGCHFKASRSGSAVDATEISILFEEIQRVKFALAWVFA